MLCTLPAATYPVLSPRELYLRNLEHEREQLIARAYAQKGAPFPALCSSSSSTEVQPPTPPAYTYDRASYFSAYPPSDAHYHHRDARRMPEHEPRHYDDKGRVIDFRESVRQRQQRLEFLRRQEFGRRLALHGLTDTFAPRPADRLAAAIKIQRAFRAHLAGKRILNALASITSDLDAAQAVAAQTLPNKSNSKTKYDAVRRAAASLRRYSSVLARLRLDYASITRPLRLGKLSKLAHARSIAARARAVDAVLAEEVQGAEDARVLVTIADMRSKMSKRPWMPVVEELPAEEQAAEDEMRALQLQEQEEEEDSYLEYYMSDESPCTSPASTLSTLSDDSLEEIVMEGEDFSAEVDVLEAEEESESEFEVAHHEFVPPLTFEEEDEDDVPTLRRTLALSLLYSASSRRSKQQKGSGHSRRRHPVLLSDFDLHMTKRLIGSQPVSRTPSLGSIAEDEE